MKEFLLKFKIKSKLPGTCPNNELHLIKSIDVFDREWC